MRTKNVFFIKCCLFHHQHIVVLKKKLRFLIKFSSTLSKWMRMSHFINKNQKRQFIWRDDLFIWGLLPGVKAWFWSNHFFYFIFCLMEIELLSLKQSRRIIVGAHKETSTSALWASLSFNQSQSWNSCRWLACSPFIQEIWWSFKISQLGDTYLLSSVCWITPVLLDNGSKVRDTFVFKVHLSLPPFSSFWQLRPLVRVSHPNLMFTSSWYSRKKEAARFPPVQSSDKGNALAAVIYFGVLVCLVLCGS